MSAAYAKCDVRGCRRRAVSAYDVRSAWERVVFFSGALVPPPLHVEVCVKHDAEFFPRGEGFVSRECSERLRKAVAR